MTDRSRRELQERYGVSDAIRDMLPKRIEVSAAHPDLPTSDVAATACRQLVEDIEQKADRRRRVRRPDRYDYEEADILLMARKAIDGVKMIRIAAEKCDLRDVLARASEMLELCHKIDVALEDLVVYGPVSRFYYEPHERLLSTLRWMAMLVSTEARATIEKCRCKCSR